MRASILWTILTLASAPVLAHTGAVPAAPASSPAASPAAPQPKPVEFSSARGYVTNIDQILTMVPPDTKVIPGHGPVTDVATLRRFRSFMSDLIGAVQTAVKAGRSKPEAVRSIRMDQYPEIKPTFRTLGNDIIAIYYEVAAAR